MSADGHDAATVAQLELAFERGAGGRTVLARRRHGYPFHVTAPLRGAGAAARLVVQSASGGLYDGERLVQRVRVGDGARAHLRFPSATVVHAARDAGGARQRTLLRVEGTGGLAWLPRPVILFPGAHLSQSLELCVSPAARVVLCDGVMLHDPAGGTPGPRSVWTETVVRDLQGRLRALDRQHLDDTAIDAARPGATGGYRAFGSVWLVGAVDEPAAAAFRRAIAEDVDGRDGVRAGVSSLPDGCGRIVRIAARDGGGLDAALERVAGQGGWPDPPEAP